MQDLRDKNINITKTLRSLSFHNFIGLCSIFFLGLIDTFFLGMKSEKDFAIAIMGSPIIFLIIGVFIGIANAKTVYFSKKINEGYVVLSEKSNYLDFIILSFLLLFVFSIFTSINDILNFIRIEDSFINETSLYIKIHYIGAFFCVANTLKSAYLRSIGDSRVPSRIMLITALLNVVLDPIFIFYFDLGAQGAAIATLSAWTIAFFYLHYYYHFELKYSLFKRKATRLFNFFKIIPSFVISQILNSITFIIIMYFINVYGSEIVAGFGFGVRLDKIVVIIAFAFGSAFTVFAGQNFSDKERCLVSYKKALLDSFLFSVGFSIVIYLLSPMVSIVFNLGDKSSEILENFLMFNIFISVFNTLYTINSSYLNVSNAHNKVLLSNMTKTLILLPILAYYFVESKGFEGIYYSLIAVSIISNIVLIVLSKKEFKTLININTEIKMINN